MIIYDCEEDYPCHQSAPISFVFYHKFQKHKEVRFDRRTRDERNGSTINIVPIHLLIRADLLLGFQPNETKKKKKKSLNSCLMMYFALRKYNNAIYKKVHLIDYFIES